MQSCSRPRVPTLTPHSQSHALQPLKATALTVELRGQLALSPHLTMLLKHSRTSRTHTSFILAEILLLPTWGTSSRSPTAPQLPGLSVCLSVFLSLSPPSYTHNAPEDLTSVGFLSQSLERTVQYPPPLSDRVPPFPLQNGT